MYCEGEDQRAEMKGFCLVVNIFIFFFFLSFGGGERIVEEFFLKQKCTKMWNIFHPD